MSQIQEIEVNGKTFYPAGIDAKGVATLRTRSTLPLLAETLSVQHRFSKNGNGAARVTLRVARPFEYKTASGATQRQVARADISFALPATASQELREEILATVSEFLDTDGVTNAVSFNEALY